MAKGTIDLVIRNFAVGSGFEDSQRGVAYLGRKLGETARMSKAFGSIMGSTGQSVFRIFSNIAQGGLKMLLQGGIWAVAFKGVNLLMDKFKSWEADTLQRLTTVTDAFKGPIAAAEKLQRALKADKAAINADRERLAIVEKTADAMNLQAKALVELNRQRRIAAGEDAIDVNSAADAQVKALENASARSKGDFAVAAAQKARQAADVGVKEAQAALDKARLELRQLEEQRYQRANALWTGENLFAANNGMRLGRGNEAAFMSGREDPEYKAKIDAIAAKTKEIEAAEQGVRDATAKAANAAEAHNAALVRRQTIEHMIAADALKAENERKAAVQKEAEEREKAAKEAEDAQAEQERIKMEAEIAAGRALQKIREDEERAAEEAEKERLRQEEIDRQQSLHKDKAANTERANDLKDKLKQAQDDVANAWAVFRDPKQIDQKAERRAARQEEIDRARLADRAIDLQARNPNWRNARNLSRQDEAARRWLLAKENEQKVKNEQKQVVDKLAKIEELLKAATTL